MLGAARVVPRPPSPCLTEVGAKQQLRARQHSGRGPDWGHPRFRWASALGPANKSTLGWAAPHPAGNRPLRPCCWRMRHAQPCPVTGPSHHPLASAHLLLAAHCHAGTLPLAAGGVHRNAPCAPQACAPRGRGGLAPPSVVLGRWRRQCCQESPVPPSPCCCLCTSAAPLLCSCPAACLTGRPPRPLAGLAPLAIPPPSPLPEHTSAPAVLLGRCSAEYGSCCLLPTVIASVPPCAALVPAPAPSVIMHTLRAAWPRAGSTWVKLRTPTAQCQPCLVPPTPHPAQTERTQHPPSLLMSTHSEEPQGRCLALRLQTRALTGAAARASRAERSAG